MNKQVLVVAPHPDDETLGCGGSLLRHKQLGDDIHWLIVTNMSEECGYSESQVEKRTQEILEVENAYGMASTHTLKYMPAGLDKVPTGDLVAAISKVIQEIKPAIVYTPYRYDVHSDHKACFDAAISATKQFRAPFIESIRVYETLSETDFNLNPIHTFSPNLWIDISDFIEEKLRIMEIFSSELGDFPFPRSIQALRAQSQLRGSQIGAEAAEAFMLLKDVQR